MQVDLHVGPEQLEKHVSYMLLLICGYVFLDGLLYLTSVGEDVPSPSET